MSTTSAAARTDFACTMWTSSVHPSGRCEPAVDLHREAILVADRLAVLEESPQHAQVERPAVARDAVVLVRALPADVGELEPGGAALGLHPEADAAAEPVVVGSSHGELELRRSGAARHARAPVVLRREPEHVLLV